MRRHACAMLAAVFMVFTPVSASRAEVADGLSQAYNGQTASDFRVGLQMRLAWTGDYTGAFNGDIAASSLRAIRDFQARHSMEASGVIDEPLLKLLLVESDAAKASSGFAMVDDTLTGARMGVPLGLVRDRGASEFGHLWRSDDDTIEIETVRMQGPNSVLDGLFSVLSKPTTDRTVETAVLSDEAFQVAGMEADRHYIVRMAGKDGDLRGFSISYEETADLTMTPVTVMAANLFEPYGASAQEPRLASRHMVAASISPVASRPQADEAQDSAKRLFGTKAVGEAWQAPAPRASADFDTSGSGFVVSDDGWVMTNAHVAKSCKTVLVGRHGAADRVIVDPTNDLALVHVDAELGAPLPMSEGVPRLGEDVLALGYPLRSLLADSLNVTRGNVSSLLGLMNDPHYLQISAPVQPGNSGGPLVDLSGRVVGVVTAKLNAVAVADATGDIPQSINFAIRPDAVVSFLRQNGIDFTPAGAPSETKSVADTTAGVEGSVVPVLCLGSK